MDVIRLETVTKRYGRNRGVIDLDLSVAEGEVFGYLGPNGAGKTTTIRLLLDLLRPTSGLVEVLGGSPKDVEIRRRVGYLPGELAMYEGMTGLEFLTYLDHLRGKGSLPFALSLADRLQLDLGRPIAELSKGNRQKIGLVQAFMHRPRLLILDEPTGGLDPLMQAEFQAVVAEAKVGGATVFLSSHVISEVERTADRVGIIREGRLVEIATLAELRARAVQRFEVTFVGGVPVGEIAALEEVSDVMVDGDSLRCGVRGSVDSFLKTIARHEVVGLASTGTELEGLFLSFYHSEQHAS